MVAPLQECQPITPAEASEQGAARWSPLLAEALIRVLILVGNTPAPQLTAGAAFQEQQELLRQATTEAAATEASGILRQVRTDGA